MRSDRIKEILKSAFQPSVLEIEDESHQHSRGGKETHLKCLIVSEKFNEMSRVQRQQNVTDLLQSEFESGLHAFTQRCLTPSEYSAGKADGFISPACASK